MRIVPFFQVNVFSDHALKGNPLAVVTDGRGLSDATMLDFARWTALSETTFLLPPTDRRADYQVRIFTPHGELAFAGHPTLGSCHVWRALQPQFPQGRDIIQQCPAGLINVRVQDDGLAFSAPANRFSGPLPADELAVISGALGLRPGQVIAHQQVGAGSAWQVLLLDSRASALEVAPDYACLGPRMVGVAAKVDAPDIQLEVRAFIGETQTEDPVTGSLNAGLARWLIDTGYLKAPWQVAQGTALGRIGRLAISCDVHGRLWIGGKVQTVIRGALAL